MCYANILNNLKIVTIDNWTSIILYWRQFIAYIIAMRGVDMDVIVEIFYPKFTFKIINLNINNIIVIIGIYNIIYK